MAAPANNSPVQVRLVRSREAERVPETGAVASVQEAEVTVPERC